MPAETRKPAKVEWQAALRPHPTAHRRRDRRIRRLREVDRERPDPVSTERPRDERTFATVDGKARFTANELEYPRIPPGRLLLRTLRSHDRSPISAAPPLRNPSPHGSSAADFGGIWASVEPTLTQGKMPYRHPSKERVSVLSAHSRGRTSSRWAARWAATSTLLAS